MSIKSLAGSTKSRADFIEGEVATVALHEEDGGLEPECVAILHTCEDGHNSGRRCVIQFRSSPERDSWVALLDSMVEEAKERHWQSLHPSTLALLRGRCLEGWGLGVGG